MNIKDRDTYKSTDKKDSENSEELFSGSETAFLRLFNSKAALISISTIDEGRFIRVNEVFLKVFGYREEDVIGKTSTDLNLFGENRCREEVTRGISEKGFVVDNVVPLKTKTGETLYVSWSAEIIRFKDREYLLNVMKDITELKLAEEKLQKSRQYLLSTNIELEKAVFRANQMAADSEIKNYQLEQEIQNRERAENINHTLFEISNAINTSADLGELYASIHKSLERIIDVTNFFVGIYIKEKDLLTFPYCVDETQKRFPDLADFSRKTTVSGKVINSGKPLLITGEEMLSNKMIAENRENMGVISEIWLGVPLKVQGEVIGLIATQSYTDPGRYTQRDVDILTSVSDQIAISIDRKRTDDALRASEERYRSIIENIRDGYGEIDLHGGIKFVNESLCKISGYDRDSLLKMNLSDFLDKREMGKLMQRYSEIFAAEKYLSYLSYNIIRKDGSKRHVEASLSVAKDSDGRKTGFIGIFRDIDDRKKYEDELIYNAYHDPLTGLNNRKAFYERLEDYLKNADRYEKELALLFIDMDKFKQVNDQLGHEAGDELLITVARRLKACLRETDFISRTGGDEFTVILPDISDQTPETVAEKIVEALSAPYSLKAGVVDYTSASIGISVFPEDAKEYGELVKKADMAMYKAKEQRNGYYVYRNNER